jgi:hypothetical protein
MGLSQVILSTSSTVTLTSPILLLATCVDFIYTYTSSSLHIVYYTCRFWTTLPPTVEIEDGEEKNLKYIHFCFCIPYAIRF